MKEQWKEIEGYEGLYWVSNLARVKNSKDKILKQSLRGEKNPYLRVSLYKEGAYKTINVHIMVAKAFVENPDNKPVINHIVPVRQGGTNLPENLEWCTTKENVQHALQSGNMRTKKVLQYTMDGDFVAEYIGVREAQRKTGIAHITEVANGIRKSAGGYLWKYKEEK